MVDDKQAMCARAHLTREAHARWLLWVAVAELQPQREDAALPRRILWAKNAGVPHKEVVV